ncbi:leucyl/phenylalanyl-tRNA--protein transferase [Albidovulum sediminis]|uniref:Leucyl/phenylalanyl-tRNA--protein transferase n=1 Tax=Albidovulum sediminis TaxID=3066345 RepID=A0ABT2NPD8_9RHOB|nr:leucyl/phenylalanyl-tRNA--protein transferase [Defluviimonas sediminis]MCT8330586.1 leucyl/phenylalanyl-tRNA--protein transferase [Defluviimonas sediminis]
MRQVRGEDLLRAYRRGIFPMAESRASGTLHWIDPRFRGVFPLDGFHISRSLGRQILRGGYTVRIDTAFRAVVEACAARDETWINDELLRLYDDLYATGHAHSLEVWQDGALAGGVFGITIGRAYFGESMFSARTGGSKIALAYLVNRLRRAGFTLFDTQFLTPHLATLGAVEIPRAEYRRRLEEALAGEAEFAAPETPQPSELVAGMRHRITQTS